MGGLNIIEWMGGTSRFITVVTFFIHFMHPLLCVSNYIHWVRFQKEVLGDPLVDGYLAMSIIAALSYLLISSVFYMWAWRFPEPEEVAKRRRIYGITVNLIFSDIPLFVIEVTICWQVNFANEIQGIAFVVTCISLAYSSLRVWIFMMIKLIKVRAPVLGPQPHFAGSAMYASNTQHGAYAPGYSSGYYGASTSNAARGPGNGFDSSGAEYGRNYHENEDHYRSSVDYRNGNAIPHDDYRHEVQYNDNDYPMQGDQFSTPGTRASRPLY